MNCTIKRVTIFVLTMFLTFAMGWTYASASTALERRKARRAEEKANKPAMGEYYTTTNMWFEKANNFFSTNFHMGHMIPAGTKVVIDKYRGSKITFTEVKTGTTRTYENIKKHSKINLRQLFDRAFSKINPLGPEGPFSKFTSEEKDNIKQGVIQEGMSKEATIMAYGYPPAHRTETLDSDSWIYWKSRGRRVGVYFSDNKISRIDDNVK